MPFTPEDAEAHRLQVLAELDVLDTPAEPAFDALVRAAALACGVPISLVSLVDIDRQWFKANLGLDGVTQTPRETAFCAHAIQGDDLFEVPDAATDPRFAVNPLVTDEPHIRFYAGAPLTLSSGERMGTLCVIDRQPRQLSAHQRQLLQHLAAAAVVALESRRQLRRSALNERRYRALSEAAPLGVYATNAQGRCTYTNERWQAFFGLTEDESLGTGWGRTLHPEDRDRVFAEWGLAAAHRLAFDLEFRVRHDDGAVRHLRSVSRPVISDDDRLTGYIGSVLDVTATVLQRQALEAAHERMALATDSGGIGIWDYDVVQDELRCDSWMQRLFGQPDGPAMGSSERLLRQLHPEDRVETTRRIGQALAGDSNTYEAEFRIVWADGSIHHLRAAARITRNAQGQPLRMVGVNWDVSALRRLGHELAEQHELLRVTLQSIGDAVVTTDAQGRVRWLNPVAERLTGWPLDAAAGQPLEQVYRVLHEDTRAPADNPVALCLAEEVVAGPAAYTMLVSRQGDEFGIESTAAPIRSAGGHILGAVLVFRDETEKRRLSGEMRHRATHDTLTGLVNRAEFESRLRAVLGKAQNSGSENALMYIDLDQFKLVNDACGHAVGDQLLQQVTKLLQDTVRAGDTLARLGGDEFAVILENCTPEQGRRVAQLICDRLDDFRFHHEGRRFRIGASIGLVPVDARWTSTAAVLQAADSSCYAAKDAGRNRVHLWYDTDADMRARQGQMQWASRLEDALDRGRFVLYAQRIVAVQTEGGPLHAEALLRLVDDDGSLIPPGAFLPAAERFHLSNRIDRWVLGRAIECLNARRDPAAACTLCVNLSGQSIGDRAFHTHAIAVLQAAGPAVCRSLCLEITETAAVNHMADAARFIHSVRALGVRIALDDFGAGASSFGYLKTLAVDVLKIDGQFIKNLLDDPLDDATVRCFVDVARVVGVKTVAEFVDRAEVLARVRELGIDHAQGYLLHRPEPIENVL